MLDEILSLLGIKRGAIAVAGFFGAAMSLWFVADRKTSFMQGVFIIFGGTLFAVYLTPVLGLLVTLSEPMERGASFMVGLFGITFANQVFCGIRSDKFRETVVGWFKRPGS